MHAWLYYVECYTLFRGHGTTTDAIDVWLQETWYVPNILQKTLRTPYVDLWGNKILISPVIS